jgi:transposase
MDNLVGAHKAEKVKQLIESRAASVIFLPAYSPDFNPIEEAFSKITRRSSRRLVPVAAKSSSRR